jgi:hypothetical protein
VHWAIWHIKVLQLKIRKKICYIHLKFKFRNTNKWQWSIKVLLFTGFPKISITIRLIITTLLAQTLLFPTLHPLQEKEGNCDPRFIETFHNCLVFQSSCLLLHLQLQVQEKSVMSCVTTHLLTLSLPPLLHGQANLQYNCEKCLFLSDVFNSSSCLLHIHIIYWLEADQYVFWLFSYNALLQTLPHLVFNLWYTKSHFLHILRTNVFWIYSLSVHATQQLVQGKMQLCVSHFKNESCEKLC